MIDLTLQSTCISVKFLLKKQLKFFSKDIYVIVISFLIFKFKKNQMTLNMLLNISYKIFLYIHCMLIEHPNDTL